jgi:hypothetical protein
MAYSPGHSSPISLTRAFASSRVKMRNQSEPSSLAATQTPISEEAFDQLFREARTHSTSLPEPVPVEFLRKVYELARLGPTSANGSPARFVLLTTPGAKARLKPVLAPGNVDKPWPPPSRSSSLGTRNSTRFFPGSFHRLMSAPTFSEIDL